MASVTRTSKKQNMSFLKKIFGNKTENQNLSSLDSKIRVSEKNVYEKSVDIFFENFENPSLIQDKILELTKSNEETGLIFLFIPHFFCRLFIPEVEWTDYYVIENNDGSKREIKFIESKILTELNDSIKLNWNNYLKREFTKILFHSGDFRAINEMLHKGSKAEDLQALPPTIPLTKSTVNNNSEGENETNKILELMFEKAIKKINYSEFQSYFIIEGNDYSKIFFNLIFTHLVLEIPKEEIVMNIFLKLEQIGVIYPFGEIEKMILGNKIEELNDEIVLYREILHMQNKGVDFETIVKKINTSH